MLAKDIKLKANSIRRNIIEMLNVAKSGHSGGALGLCDIYSVLYFDILKHNPKNPQLKTRDFVIVSNGHTCPVLYSSLAESGYFPKKELKTLRQINSRLQGHPHYGSLPGVENSGGPLGQGISQAVGLAASLKRDGKKNNVFCFVGDGELEEGQCWEAIMFAAKENLNNLILIVDRNFLQIDGNTEEVEKLGSIHKKLSAFGWMVIDLDGNNIHQIKHALKEAVKAKHRPVCLVARTIMGKGVSFMENKALWHGKAPNDEETKIALKELEEERSKIEKGEL